MALPPKSFGGIGRHLMAVPVIHQGRALTNVPILFTLVYGFRTPVRPAFFVELWDENDQRVEELIALTADYGIGRAAYEEALKKRPGRIVTLRQKTRVLADSRRQI